MDPHDSASSSGSSSQRTDVTLGTPSNGTFNSKTENIAHMSQLSLDETILVDNGVTNKTPHVGDKAVVNVYHGSTDGMCKS